MIFKAMRILSLEDLDFAIKNHKAVICPKSMAFNKPKPAAVIINLQAAYVLKLIRLGMYVYERKDNLMKDIELNEIQKKHIESIEWLLFGRHKEGKTVLLRYIYDKAKKEKQDMRRFQELVLEISYLIEEEVDDF